MMWKHVIAISIIILLYGLLFVGGFRYIHKLEEKKEGDEDEPK